MMKQNKEKRESRKHRKQRRLLIGLLAALALGIGCVGIACAGETNTGIDVHTAAIWVHNDSSHGGLEATEDGYHKGQMFITCRYSDELDPKTHGGLTCGICEYWLELELYINTPDNQNYNGKPHEAWLTYKWLSGGDYPKGYERGIQKGTPKNIEGLKHVKTEYEGIDGTSYDKTTNAPKDPGKYLVTATISIEQGGLDPNKYTFSKEFTILKPEYDVQFDPNVPKDASTQIEGKMENQHFEYYFDDMKTTKLDLNQYKLPGYTFEGWIDPNKPGTPIADGASVGNLTDQFGTTYTLMADWKPMTYTIYCHDGAGDNGTDLYEAHSQTATFDRPGTLDAYSDAKFGWTTPDHYILHGWTGTMKPGSFYADGAKFFNLCGKPDKDGNLSNVDLTADWITGGKIVATVTLDGGKPPWIGDGFKDCFTLVASGSGDVFRLHTTYDNNSNKYTFDPTKDQEGAAQTISPGEYDLILDTGKKSITDPRYMYAPARVHITYGNSDAVSAVFPYYEFTAIEDPAYPDTHTVDISAEADQARIHPRDNPENPVIAVAPEGGEVTIRTEFNPGYHFDGYSCAGVPPTWNPDASVAEQKVQVNGGADIMAHVEANVYTVKFKANTSTGIRGNMADQDMVYDEAQNLFANEFKRKGWNFKEWNTKPDGSGIRYQDGAQVKNLTTSNGGTVTLYAQWEFSKNRVKSVPVEIAWGTPSGKKAVKAGWTKVNGAAKYLVYAGTSGKKMKLVKKTGSTSCKVKKIKGKKLKAHKPYTFYVVAVDKKGKTIAKSKKFTVITAKSMGKYANVTKITAKTNAVDLNVGQSVKLKAAYTLPKGKKHLGKKKYGAYPRFTSDTPKVASVNSAGNVKALYPGRAVVYIQDTCGRYCKTIVTVQ